MVRFFRGLRLFWVLGLLAGFGLAGDFFFNFRVPFVLSRLSSTSSLLCKTRAMANSITMAGINNFKTANNIVRVF